MQIKKPVPIQFCGVLDIRIRILNNMFQITAHQLFCCGGAWGVLDSCVQPLVIGMHFDADVGLIVNNIDLKGGLGQMRDIRVQGMCNDFLFLAGLKRKVANPQVSRD